ncbi:MAG: reverse transcriptase/maturase family protein [Desulfobulbaceae bacterium]|nr:reverse transcriptase/maturase family protein [Desulfobulbaceae bacterium]
MEQVADYANFALAAWKAGRGKRLRDDVRAFFADFDASVNGLARDLLRCWAPRGLYKEFTITDPKKRLIHAACFADRVLHHALINLIGPVLERAMVGTSFACRPGKGPVAAARQVQKNIRRFPWYVKIDIAGYFPAIDHEILFSLLQRRLKGRGILELLRRIIDSYSSAPGKGLPIGSLTSQHFANYYLDGLDRYLTEQLKARGYVRYMDDIIWWCNSREEARKTLGLAEQFVEKQRNLRVKDGAQINQGRRGVSFCGFRILPGVMRISRRRRRLYQQRRKMWEQEYIAGRINGVELQARYAAVHAIVANGDSTAWRRENLRRHPAIIV